MAQVRVNYDHNVIHHQNSGSYQTWSLNITPLLLHPSVIETGMIFETIENLEKSAKDVPPSQHIFWRGSARVGYL